MNAIPPAVAAARAPALAASCVPGIRWPGLPTAAGATMLAMQWQLERSQWWPRERLAEQQFRQLRVLVDHARQNVPHYQHVTSSMALPVGEALVPGTIGLWPLLRKGDLRGRESEMRAVTWPSEHGSLIETATTGSTGQPVRLAFTEAAQFFTHALVLRHHLWHGSDFGGKLALMITKLEDGAAPNWGRIVSAAFATGPCAMLNIAAPIERQLAWLIGQRPDYLQTFPSNLRAMVRLSCETGRRPEGLRAVITLGEMLPPGLREAVREAWGAEILDTYSCGEFGTLALQCPGHDHYHVQSESVILEVLRDDGAPCAPGEIGRVVVTSLHNFAMPLIRYELGDYAETGEACACGRGLPVLRRIVGRVRNLARDPTGRRFWPSIISRSWPEAALVRQFRLVQHTPARIEVQYVMDRPLAGDEVERLRAALHESLRYPFEIDFSHLEAIVRTPGEKFEDFISLLDEP